MNKYLHFKANNIPKKTHSKRNKEEWIVRNGSISAFQFHAKRRQPNQIMNEIEDYKPKAKRARSTDCDKLTANNLTEKQRFRHSDLVTDFATVISSQSEGLGKMAQGIVKYA